MSALIATSERLADLFELTSNQVRNACLLWQRQ
jgi:hypothetical protein